LRLNRLPNLSLSAAGILVALLAFSSVIFGGASQRHDYSLALVELVAIPLLGLAIYRLVLTGAWRTNRWLLLLVAAVISLPIAQLIPLPASVWTSLPGREPSVLALELLGQTPGWQPMSLTPDATRAAIWALLPPVALLLAMMVMDTRTRLVLAALFLVSAAASLLLSWAQIASGAEALYLYPHTKVGAVGFSANRNHLATLVLMGLPIAAAVGTASFWGRSAYESSGRWLFGLYAVLAIITVGLMQSRAGIVMAGPVLIGSLFLMWQATGRSGSGWKAIGFAGLAASGVAAVAAFGLTPILARFDAMKDASDGRFDAWPTVIEAGGLFQPIGAGLGSFDPVFRSVEPLADLSPVFFNRAHNDYLEIWLEAGIVGVALVALGLVWFAWRWRASWMSTLTGSNATLARAAGFSVLVVVFHSLVDYPIRTETIAVFVAFCLGTLTMAPSVSIAKR